MDQASGGGYTPAQQAYIDNWIKASNAAVQQPTANLQQTQAQTGEAGAVAESAVQSAQTSAQERANLEAQNPGIQATAQSEQINALQKKAPINLSSDLKANKMTLPAAMSKYKALGMSPDAIFSQYVSESPWGAPNETPAELQQKYLVTAGALGDPKTPGSFLNKYNTKNAIDSLRSLEDTWNQTDTLSHIPFVGGADASARAYQAQKQIVASHLSSLIPGASSSEGSNQGFANSLPNIGDLASPAAAKGQFAKIEEGLMQSNGYSYKDLGLSPRLSQVLGNTTSSSPTSTGGGLLSGILGMALNPTIQAVNGINQQNSTIKVNGPTAGIAGLGNNISANAQGLVNGFNNTLGNPAIWGQAATLASAGDLVALGAKIPALLAGKTGAKVAATLGVDNLPGAIKTFINPKGAINQAGGVRDAVVSAASKAGRTVNGDSLLSDITSWAQKAKIGNLGQGKAIDTAVSDAEGILKGQKLDPQDLMKAYNEADSGFTTNGVAKTPIQANIDRGLRDILAKHLDDVAPGWRDSTKAMAKAYQVQKSPVRAGVKNLAKFGIPIAVGAQAGDLVKHVLFGG